LRRENATSCAYVTVGTGVGVGLVVNGAPVHGLMHPEGGHVMPTRHPDDTYGGCTSLHPTSVEAMAAAQACAERCGVAVDALAGVDDADPAWDMVAYYLAQLCLSITLTVSPHFIVMSGGVMQRSSLFPRVRSHFAELNDGYIDVPKIRDSLDTYIVPSAFGSDAGIIGACELARRALL
jgi:fructokinase